MAGWLDKGFQNGDKALIRKPWKTAGGAEPKRQTGKGGVQLGCPISTIPPGTLKQVAGMKDEQRIRRSFSTSSDVVKN